MYEWLLNTPVYQKTYKTLPRTHIQTHQYRNAQQNLRIPSPADNSANNLLMPYLKNLSKSTLKPCDI